MNIEQLRRAHRLVSVVEYNGDDMHPLDLDEMPKAIHAYDVASDATYYIIEMDDGFHYAFLHPCDSVAPTLNAAEIALVDEFVQYI